MVRNSDMDELARRRAAREREAGGDDDTVRFTWTDTLAMIIAAYQVLMPIVLLMIGILLVVYLLFRVFFH